MTYEAGTACRPWHHDDAYVAVRDGSDETRPILNVPGSRATCGLPRDPGYDGPLRSKQPEEVAYILAEAFDYLGLGFSSQPPLPIDYGHSQGRLLKNDLASEAYLCIVHMLRDIASGKPRSTRKAWTDLIGMFRAAEIAAIKQHVEREAAAQQQRVKAAKTFVYFIGSASGEIKIGFSNNPKSRLTTLQTSSSAKLSILAQTEGSLDTEAAYHRQFGAHRLHGEWFARHPDIIAEIDRLNTLKAARCPPPASPSR